MDHNRNQDHDKPSKTQRKRDAHALQRLGAELVALGASQLNQLTLPEDLRKAVEEARRISQRGGRKRQIQYIGKLLRNLDPQPIRDQLDKLRNRDRQAAARFHQLEHWRDRLIAEGDPVVNEVLNTFPHGDRQRLRHLVRQARQEQQDAQPPRATRALFAYLRELQETGEW